MTSEVRRVQLDRKSGYLDSSILPLPGGCNILCLSDRQVRVINSFVFPMARWETRTVVPVEGMLYQTDPDSLALMVPELDDLELQLNGGNTMGCESLAEAIIALSDAIAAGGGGGGTGTSCTVYCGGGAVSGVAGEIAKLTNDQLLPPADVEAPVPGAPPEGFETWQAYELYKCQAAHVIWGQLRALAVANSVFVGLAAVASEVAPIVAGLSGVFAAGLTPLGFVALVGAMVAVGAIDVYCYLAFTQWVAWWDANKDQIVCELYTSGSAAAAVTAVNNLIEDGIQAIVWDGLLAGLAGPGALAIGAVFSAVEGNSLVSPLFKLFATVSMPGVSCVCESPFYDIWHFPLFAEYWAFTKTGAAEVSITGAWEGSPPTPDPSDPSHGCLYCVIDAPSSGSHGVAVGTWRYTFPVASRPVAAAGFGLRYDRYHLSYDHECGARIVYAEGGSDSALFGTLYWANTTIYCSSGNYGKHIAYVEVYVSVKADSHVDGWWAADFIQCRQF